MAALAAEASVQTESPTHWAGWYAGGTFGYAGTSTATTDTTYSDFGGTLDHYIDGGTVGLVGGYNWVKNNGLFYGAEADVNAMSNKGEFAQCAPNNCVNFGQAKSNWMGYGTVRGRAGMAFDQALIFLTGGLAVADVKDTWTPQSQNGGTLSEASTGWLDVGWTAGAGVEFALAERISLSTQYLHLGMATRGASGTCSGGGCSVPTFNFEFKDSVDILRVGVNYKF